MEVPLATVKISSALRQITLHQQAGLGREEVIFVGKDNCTIQTSASFSNDR